MKKIVLLVALIGVGTVLPYLKKDEWHEIKEAAKCTKKCDPDFFSAAETFFQHHPQVRHYFTKKSKQVKVPAWGPAIPDDQEKGDYLEKQGFKVSEEYPDFFEYRTTPNHNFPGTFDAETDLWIKRPKVLVHSGNMDKKTKDKLLKRTRAIIKERDEAIEKAGARNLYKGNLNIVIPVGEEEETVIKGTSARWTTYPHVLGSYVSACNMQHYLDEQGFTDIRVPRTELLFLSEEILKPSDNNMCLIQENIKALTADQLIAEIQKPEKERAPVFNQMEQFLDPAKQNPLWEHIILFDADEDGGVQKVTKMDMLFRKDTDGVLRAYFVDTENPSLAGPRPDEERSKDFSPTHLPMYGPNNDASQSWFAFVAAAQKQK